MGWGVCPSLLPCRSARPCKSVCRVRLGAHCLLTPSCRINRSGMRACAESVCACECMQGALRSHGWLRACVCMCGCWCAVDTWVLPVCAGLSSAWGVQACAPGRHICCGAAYCAATGTGTFACVSVCSVCTLFPEHMHVCLCAGSCVPLHVAVHLHSHVFIHVCVPADGCLH